MFGGIAVRGKLLVLASGGTEGLLRIVEFASGELRSNIVVPSVSGGRVEAGGLCLDEDGSLLLADGAACQIRRFSAFGSELAAIGLPPEKSQPRDRRGLPAQARGLAMDSHGRLWVSSGDRPRVHGLQVFSPKGQFLQSIPAFGARDRLYGPGYAVRIFGDRVWLADTGNQCLQQFRDDGSFFGYYELEKRCGAARQPIDLAPYAGGLAVLFLEPEPRVFALDREMERAEPLVLGGLQLPTGLANGPDGELLIADREGTRLRMFAQGECREIRLPLD
ncbi:MAG: hypothetical protein CSA62_13850 [Planctomycetota bacterium]|nr:MAG: hypothetical protein CSA62_13850 [Planctomycetota bacterium]